MADEITLNLKMTVQNGFLVQRFEPAAVSVTMIGTTAAGGVQPIGTAAELLSVGEVTTCGCAYFRNTDATNFIEIGTGTGTFVPFAKLKAGEIAVVRLGTNAPSARANTAIANLQYWILQD